MAPSAVPVNECGMVAIERNESRPSKRPRLYEAEHNDDSAASVPAHPLGIKPSGNAFSASVNLKDATGRFALLPDELIIQILEHLTVSSLIHLGSTCKALFAYSRAEELWKPLFIE